MRAKVMSRPDHRRLLRTGCQIVVLLAAAVGLSACSSGSAAPDVALDATRADTTSAGSKKAAAPNTGLLRTDLLPQIGPKVKARDANEAYQLTPDELKLDCKKLTGKMQVRLLQVRDQRERTLTTTASQLIQRSVVPVFGGSPHGARPDDDFKRDRAWLEAYNAQLAAKKCPTYNLENELQPRSIRDTPKPVPNPDAADNKAAGKTKN
jgi:hypothetical protein